MAIVNHEIKSNNMSIIGRCGKHPEHNFVNCPMCHIENMKAKGNTTPTNTGEGIKRPIPSDYTLEGYAKAMQDYCNYLEGKVSVSTVPQEGDAEFHVFEATIKHSGRKVWQYFYNDNKGLNQHSEYFDTKELAISDYNKKFGVSTVPRNDGEERSTDMTCEFENCTNTNGKDYVRLPKEEVSGWKGDPTFLCNEHSKGHTPSNAVDGTGADEILDAATWEVLGKLYPPRPEFKKSTHPDIYEAIIKAMHQYRNQPSASLSGDKLMNYIMGVLIHEFNIVNSMVDNNPEFIDKMKMAKSATKLIIEKLPASLPVEGVSVGVKHTLKFSAWCAVNLWTFSELSNLWYEYQNDDNPITGEMLYAKFWWKELDEHKRFSFIAEYYGDDREQINNKEIFNIFSQENVPTQPLHDDVSLSVDDVPNPYNIDLAAENEVMVNAFAQTRKLFEMRTWIMEGRGSYPYNDERYKEEVRYLFDEFDALAKDVFANLKSKSVDFRNAVLKSVDDGDKGIGLFKTLNFTGHPMTCCGYEGCKREINDGILIERDNDFICPCGKYTQPKGNPQSLPLRIDREIAGKIWDAAKIFYRAEFGYEELGIGHNLPDKESFLNSINFK